MFDLTCAADDYDELRINILTGLIKCVIISFEMFLLPGVYRYMELIIFKT
jgi:hypothetical protein